MIPFVRDLRTVAIMVATVTAYVSIAQLALPAFILIPALTGTFMLSAFALGG